MPILLSPKFALIVPSGATTESLNQHPIGTGSFTLDQFTPGQPKRTYQRNPNYWLAGLPKAPCVEITSITDPIGRMAALTSGDIDLDLGVDPTSVPALKANPGVELKGSPGGGYSLSLVMWVDTPPFNDIRVRQAMKLVVDRQAMVQSALLGFGEFGNDNPVPPTRSDSYRKDEIVRDVAKAKELLAAAGYPNGLEVDLYTAKHFPGIDLMGQAYAQMAADAGIKVNIVNTPVESYWDDVWLKRAFSTTYMGPRPTPSALTVTLRSTSDWNESHWFQPKYDALLDQASATPDPEARHELYQDAQRMVAEEGGMITPVLAGVVAGLREGCSGYEPHIDTNRMDLKTLTCE
jgi:peptide/nickel transport system substrate-binding protein